MFMRDLNNVHFTHNVKMFIFCETITNAQNIYCEVVMIQYTCSRTLR